MPFDLILWLLETRDGILLTLAHDRELLGRDAAEQLLAGYVDTLRRLCQDPDLAIDAVLSAPTADTNPPPRTSRLPPLIPVARRGDLPLSYAQERLWFLDRLDPCSAAYHMTIARRLRGRLDADALRRACESLVARHEVLRTAFPARRGDPVQEIREPTHHELPILDVHDDAQLAQVARAEAMAPFDLAAGPLLRTRLLRQGRDDHVFLATMHHIVSDGWSLALLWRELGALYSAQLRIDAPSLTPLSIQYADHAAWQRSWLRGDELRRQVAAWKERLAGAAVDLALPFKGPRPPVQTTRGASLSAVLDAGPWQRLREIGRRQRATPFMTLLAGFRALLARVTGQDDLCIGTPVAGRDHPAVRGLIGCFVNTLVLRARVDRQAGFAALVAGERQAALAAFAQQQTPFEALVAALGAPRRQDRTPLFQVMFAAQEVAWERDGLGPLASTPFPLAGETAQVDLAAHVFEQDGHLTACLVYNQDLFEHDTVDQLARDYVALLEGAARDPDRPIRRA
jgi:hypothetical protein